MDVSRHILVIDTSILATSNMNQREQHTFNFFPHIILVDEQCSYFQHAKGQLANNAEVALHVKLEYLPRWELAFVLFWKPYDPSADYGH
jgi:hypothetical protein